MRARTGLEEHWAMSLKLLPEMARFRLTTGENVDHEGTGYRCF